MASPEVASRRGLIIQKTNHMTWVGSWGQPDLQGGDAGWRLSLTTWLMI